METLLEVVDPDASNRTFDGPDGRFSSVSVTSDYCGEAVTVAADGIRIARPD